VRVLALETSTSQAAVALVEQGQLVLTRAHTRPKQSAERLLPLIAELLDEAGWSRQSLDRIGVSLGPGSFTGLRVGIACAQGLALGLDIPLLGVTALRAMARAVPMELEGTRVALLDARRDELFCGAYGPGPEAPEILEPMALPRETARQQLEQRLSGPLVWIGSGLSLLGLSPRDGAAPPPSPETEEPSAHAVGLLAEALDPAGCPAIPVYVRDAGATLPQPR
jgi:tRNA threonylcarbamoyladenosine biosynthesis protein TsaB